MSYDQFVVLVYGLLIGSFLNVVIYRLPLKKGLAMERSNCPKCKKLIFWYENIPVLSYLFLRGRCSQCKTKISLLYPFVELISGLGALYIYSKYSVGGQVDWTNFILMLLIFFIFICHFFIDIKHFILPDSLNIILLIVALIYSVPKFPPTYWLVGGLLGFGSTFFITYLFYKLRGKIGLGGGDIKLYGILGILLGPIGVFHNIFLSSMLGSLLIISFISLGKMNKNQPIAFGPSIIVIACFQLYFSESFKVFMNLIGQ